MADTTRLTQQIAQQFVKARVVDIPAGDLPKGITVRLLTSDGPAQVAVWNGFPELQLGDIIECRRSPNDYDLLLVGGGALNPSVLYDFMKWRDVWTPGSYTRFDTVYDNGWAMVANKSTTDRAAPQPTGDPFWVSGLGDSPAWDIQSSTVSSILSGQRYTSLTGGYLDGARLWIPEVNPLVSYSVYLVLDPTGTPIFDPLLTNLQPGSTGWLELNLSERLLRPGITFDLIVNSQSETGASQWSGPWDYKRSNGDPGEKEIYHQSAGGGSEMRINYVDNDETDRSTELTALQIGDEIEGGGITWEILDIDPQVDHIRFQVSPAQRIASEAVYTFTFTTYAPTPIQYVRILNHYVAVPEVQGLYSESGYSGITPDQNAYGIDIRVQGAVVSEDWDLLAHSEDVIGGPGGGASQLTDLSDVTITAPTNQQGLIYNSGSGQWENQNQAGGGGGGDVVKLAENILVAPGTFDFATLAQTYSMLEVELYVRTDKSTSGTFGPTEYDGAQILFNGDTGNNYTGGFYWHTMSGILGGSDGLVSVATPRGYGILSYINGNGARTNAFSKLTILIPGYASTTLEKVAEIRSTMTGNQASATDYITSNGEVIWRSVSGISRIQVFPFDGTNFLAQSYMIIYGRT